MIDTHLLPREFDQMQSVIIRTTLAVLLLSSSALAEPDRDWNYEPAPANLEAREWFQDAKFGIFIHWGVYSELGGAGEQGIAEWVMERKKIPIDKYERLTRFFNPVDFDADEWVQAFKSAGAKYVTITSKHHDGFAMYDSDASDYDIVERTAFGRDVIAELKEACDRHGLKLFFYYSQLDWHHPDYYPRGMTGNVYTGRPESGDWDEYIDYMNAQLTELLTNYGDIGGIWFDGWWDQKDTPMRDRWRLEETYKLIHRLQPQALIISNHHVTPFPGEDAQPFEQDLPGENSAGFNTSHISELPLEMAQTMNGSWGFNLIDDNFKSTDELIRTLVSAAGRNANYLMNTGPMPNGELQPENVATYAEIGAWLEKYGESVYGTRGGPLSPRPWGVTTHKDGAVYVHVLDWTDTLLPLPLDVDVEKATLLQDGSRVDVEKTGNGYLLRLPEQLPAGPVLTIRLEIG
ncbi:MAG TPA: alpha-L-fucosidase [Woeseiaceae bacterium]|nr:alpha-L-fucosidase [Woeseiaceae bacterium]